MAAMVGNFQPSVIYSDINVRSPEKRTSRHVLDAVQNLHEQPLCMVICMVSSTGSSSLGTATDDSAGAKCKPKSGDEH